MSIDKSPGRVGGKVFFIRGRMTVVINGSRLIDLLPGRG
jgi:hypothetical protein